MSALPPNDAERGYAKTEIVPPPPPKAPSAVDRNALPVGTLLGEFELLGVVGIGGFGIVYRAWDRSLKRTVAIKEYLPSSLAERGADLQVRVRSAADQEIFDAGLESFVKEAQMLAQFDHPSLVKVYRFWEANGSAYMVMPFYEGRTLRDELRRRGGVVDEATLLGWIGPVADALAVVHAELCYHRDIAPDNVMLLDGSNRPLLLDFGAARRVIGDRTQALTAILKPGYAPVEQYGEVPGLKQGPWTDIYALAGVAHFVLRGKTPPPSVGRLINDQYEKLSGSDLEGHFSTRLLAAVDHALAVRPDGRTKTVSDFKSELGLPPPPVATPVPGSTSSAAPAAAPAPGADIDVTQFDGPGYAATAVGARPPTDMAPTERVVRQGDYAATERVVRQPEYPPTERVARPGDYAPTERVARDAGYAATERVVRDSGFAPTERVGRDAAFAQTMRVVPPAAARAPEAPPPPPVAAPTAAAVAPAAPQPGSSNGRWIGIGIAAAALIAVGGYFVARPGGNAAAPTPAPGAAPAPAAAPVAAAPAPAAAAFDIDADFDKVAAAQTAGWGIDIKLDRERLRIGKDRVSFSIRSLQDGLVYVFSHGNDGSLQQLYPNGLTPAPRIAKGGTMRLPQGNLEFNVDGPAGVTKLLVLVSRWPRDHNAFSPKVESGFTSFPTGPDAAKLAAANPGPLPLIAGRAICPSGQACADEFGAATARFEVTP